MSHVWGQTIPTNHWKLKRPERQFRTGEDVLAREVREEILEEIMEQMSDEIKDTLRRKIRKELGEEIASSIDIDDVLRRQLRKQIDAGDIARGIDPSDLVNNKVFIRGLAGDIGGSVEQTVSRQIRQAMVREAGENLVKATDKPLRKTMIRWGVGLAGVVYLINSDAVNQLVEAGTGMDCDRRANEAGYIEGDIEYTEKVETCQEKAAEGMAQVGRIMAYGGIGIVAIIGLIVVMRFLPKKKEGADDEE